MQIHVYKDENRVNVDEQGEPTPDNVRKCDIKFYAQGPEARMDGVTGETISAYGPFVAEVQNDHLNYHGQRGLVWPLIYSEKNPRTGEMDRTEFGFGVTVPFDPEAQFYRKVLQVIKHPTNKAYLFVVKDELWDNDADNRIDMGTWRDGEVVWELDLRKVVK